MKVLFKPRSSAEDASASENASVGHTSHSVVEPTKEVMKALVAELARVQRTYYPELKAARDRIKKNFLK